MKRYKQLIVDPEIGDCFRACMATLLQLPPQVLPNDHSQYWWFNWQKYLSQFGLELFTSSASGPIWSQFLWIASVKSLNYENGTHAILMHNGGIVFHDPSTKKRYKTGTDLLGEDSVIGGQRLEVADTGKLHKLEEYRKELIKSPYLSGKNIL